MQQLRLITLNMAHNRLSRNAIHVVCQLATLQHLDLQDNGLTELPEEIRQLTRMSTLNLANNRISLEGIKNLCELSHVQTLDLSENELTELPTEIGLLQSLRTCILNGR